MKTAAPSRLSRVMFERGAALVVGLVLLLVLTLLGVSGLSTATLELTVANNAQFQQAAFQAAETGIEIAIAQRHFAVPGEIALIELDDGAEAQVLTTFEAVTPAPPPGSAADLEADGEQALHFRVTAFGRAPRGAVSIHRQGFYVLAPAGSSPADLAGAALDGRLVRTYWSQEHEE